MHRPRRYGAYRGRHRAGAARTTGRRAGAARILALAIASLIVAGAVVAPTADAQPSRHHPGQHRTVHHRPAHSYIYRLRARASLQVWARVAACESARTWHIDTHNGYYGGLQFSQATWVGFGGRKYARRADHATRLEQIAVARRVLAVQGPKAWPVCGKRAHLTRADGFATRSRLPNL